VAGRHIRAVIVSNRRTKAGGRIAVSATNRASDPSAEAAAYDTKVGRKVRNSRTVNAPKRW
jgi:hypothetical protein